MLIINIFHEKPTGKEKSSQETFLSPLQQVKGITPFTTLVHTVHF